MKTNLQNRFFVLLLTLSFIVINCCNNGVIFSQQKRGDVREWTAKSGHKITGELIAVNDGTVQIALANGKTVKVKLEQLSDKDQHLIESRNKKQNENPFEIEENPIPPKKNNSIKFDWKIPLDALKAEAEKDNPDAQLELAVRYFEGRHGCHEDESKASEWFQKGAKHADKGSPAGQTCKGICYQEGLGVKKNETEAVRWFRKAAEQGNAEAQTNLGFYYGDGLGVSKNHKESFKWFRKAAEQGYAKAQYCLGICYDIGEGVDEDPDEAIKWFLKSAKQGFPDAIEALCEMGICETDIK
jgi:TPR repeat protein